MKKIFNCVILMVLACCMLLSARYCSVNTAGNYYNVKIDRLDAKNPAEEVIIRNRRLDKPGKYNLSFEYNSRTDYRVFAYDLASYNTDSDSVNYIFDTVIPAGNSSFSADFEIAKSRNEFSVVLMCNEEIPQALSLSGISLTSHTPVFKDTLFFALSFSVFCLAAALYLLYVVNSKKDYSLKKELFVISISLAAVIFVSSYPYYSGNYPTGHDIIFHNSRIAGLADFLHNGEGLIHRVNTAFNSGYGYINPIMYPELFLYIPGGLAAAGMSVLGALKLFNILINTATVLLSYFSFKGITGNRYSGLILATVYSLATYRLVNIYVRNAVGESLFMTFIPVAVYGLYAIFYKNSRLSWIWLFLGVTGVVQSHILGCVLTVIILVSYLILIIADKIDSNSLTIKPFIDIIVAAVATLCINIWFIVPFAYYYLVQPLKLFTQLEYFFSRIPSVNILLSLFAEGITTEELNLPMNLGPLVLAAAVVAIARSVWFVLKKKGKLFEILSVFFILLYSVIITNLVPYELLFKFKPFAALMSALQFTFRFHSVVLITVCIVLAHCILKSGITANLRLLKLSTAVTLAIALFGCYDLFNSSSVWFYNSKERYISNDSPNEYFMEAVNLDAERAKIKKVEESENIILTAYDKTGRSIEFSYEKTDENPGSIKLPLFYYYGYNRVTDDGRAIELYSGENGAIRLTLPEDIQSGNIRVYFNDNLPIFRYPLYFSVFSCLAVAAYAVYIRKREKI